MCPARTRGAKFALVLASSCFLVTVPGGAVGQLAKKARPQAAKSAPASPSAPIPKQIEVAKGDTLFRIAGKVRHAGTTLFQTVLALYRANTDAFLNGNINQLVVGRVLAVPGPEDVLSVDPAKAAQQVKELAARPVVVPPPAPPAFEPKEAPAPKAKPTPPPKPQPPTSAVTPAQAEARFQEGLKSERQGDLKAAMASYLAAGESGNAMAQKRLGDIYNTGNAVVTRDYEIALKWYQKARAQGVEIPKPITYPGVPR